MQPRETLARLRALLAATYLLGALGTGLELFLLEHHEGGWQRVPLVALAAGALALAWALVSGRALAVRAFQAVMAGSLAAALAGLWQHHRANVEFELEVYPELSGWDLLWKSVHGVAPPALAPGTLALLALVGLAWAYHHPSLGGDESQAPPARGGSKP